MSFPFLINIVLTRMIDQHYIFIGFFFIDFIRCNVVGTVVVSMNSVSIVMLTKASSGLARLEAWPNKLNQIDQIL